MTSHCNGCHLKTSLSVSVPSTVAGFFFHNPSYVTASQCMQSFCLKELEEWQDPTVTSIRGRSFHILTEKHQRRLYLFWIYYIYVYHWPRQTRMVVPSPRVGTAYRCVCVQVKYSIKYSGASLSRNLHMNRPLLYSSSLCRLIIFIFFNFQSVVRVVSGKINFTDLCRGFNLFLRTLLHERERERESNLNSKALILIVKDSSFRSIWT